MGNFLAYSESRHEFSTKSFLLSFIVQSMSLYIEMNMTRSSKFCRWILSSSSINFWTAWRSFVEVGPGKIFHSNTTGSLSTLFTERNSGDATKYTILSSPYTFATETQHGIREDKHLCIHLFVNIVVYQNTRLPWTLLPVQQPLQAKQLWI